MSDRAAATAGFVFTGAALAAALGDWSARTPRFVALGAAAVAILAFLSGRHGLLDRRRAAPLAAIGSVGIVAAGVAGVGGASGVLLPGATAAAGVFACAFAWADWRGTSRDRLVDQAQSVVVGGLIGIVGLLASIVWLGLLAGAQGALPGSLPTVGTSVLSTVAGGLGFVTATAGYVVWSGRDRSFIDIAMPDRREWGYVFLATVAILAVNVGTGVLVDWLGVESTDHVIFVEARSNPEILLTFVPLSYLVVAPSEELLFRNVIQKSLRDQFSRYGTVVVATLIFAAVHFSAFNTEGSTLAFVSTLGIVFVSSLILGVAYELTHNLTVSVLVHGTNNAVAFAVTYAELTGLIG
jgi:membrane protease YdiL (CAAX protease family)